MICESGSLDPEKNIRYAYEENWGQDADEARCVETSSLVESHLNSSLLLFLPAFPVCRPNLLRASHHVMLCRDEAEDVVSLKRHLGDGRWHCLMLRWDVLACLHWSRGGGFAA